MNQISDIFAWCAVRFPSTVNVPSPVSPTNDNPSPYPTTFPYTATGRWKERLCLVSNIDIRDGTATIYLGSTNPQILHRFAPVSPTMPHEAQISPALETTPPFTLNSSGYLNISNPLSATVYFVNDRNEIQNATENPVDVFPTAARFTAESQRRFHAAVSAYQRRRLQQRRPVEEVRGDREGPDSTGGGPGEDFGGGNGGSPAESIRGPAASRTGAARSFADAVRGRQARSWMPGTNVWDDIVARYGESATPMQWPNDADLRIVTNFRPRPCIQIRPCRREARFCDESDVVSAFMEEAWSPRFLSPETI